VCMLALLAYPAGSPGKGERFRFWLDVGTVLLGGWMVVWHFVLGPVARASGAGDFISAVYLAYPLGNLVLLFVAVTTLLRCKGASRTITYMVGSLLAFVVGNLCWAYLDLEGTGMAGSILEPIFFLGGFLMVLSAHAEIHPGEQSPRPVVVYTRLMPYAAIVLGYGLLLLVVRQHADQQLRELVYGAVGLTVAVMVRQVATARENTRLTSENAVRASEARFGSLIRHSSDVITIVDADLKIVYQSPSVERVFGYAPADLAGTHLTVLFGPDQAVTAATLLRQAAEPGDGRLVEWDWVHRDGSVRHTETVVNNLLHDPNVQGLVLNTRDVTDRRRLEDQVRYQAFHDPLTGLANRDLFRDRVQQALAEQVHRAEPVTVLFLDLDNFKTINDSLGPTTGDQLLVAVAERLCRSVRHLDTVARLGGDEFAVLLKWIPADEAAEVAQRIIVELQAPFHLDGREVRVNTSVGLSGSMHGAGGVEELLRNADVAMNSAKGEGKGCLAVFHPSMYAAVRDRMELEAGLRHAVEAGQFVLHYQPTICLETGLIRGVEALVRWRHPQRGTLFPGQFIAIAEETGLILPLGAEVLRQACRQLRDWQERFPHRAPLTMSVNLSGRQVLQPDLVEQVIQAVRESGVDPACLVLEITESVLMHTTEALLDRLRALRKLGVRLAIDDFGTGYSSLSYLHRFRVDILKVDRSFVEGLGTSAGSTALLNGILNLARALGLQTVAEGVEKAGQQATLRALGCNFGQGYYYGCPVNAAQIEHDWLSGTRPLPKRKRGAPC
ncbi:MAG TPA: EAL domain-containing protein, partial [Symbiobacteriaceae bacterium]|nr:EAL domain-containing protein [Symbiobacteriaceae bacterium]